MEAVEFKDIESIRTVSINNLCKRIVGEIDRAADEGKFTCDVDLGPVGADDIGVIIKMLAEKGYASYQRRGPCSISVYWTKF